MNSRKQFETCVFVSLKTMHGLQLFNRKREIRNQTSEIIHTLIQKYTDEEIELIIRNITKKEAETERLVIETLVALSVQENAIAFHIIIDRYNDTIMKEINNFIGGIPGFSDFEKVHEKSVEIWDKVQKHIDKFDSKKAGFFTWIKKIAENMLKNSEKKMNELTEYMSEQSEDKDDSGNSFEKLQFQNTRSIDSAAIPDEKFNSAYKSKLIFQNAFRKESGYPWQVICFGLIATGKKPGEIAARYATNALCDLCFLLKEEIELNSIRDEEDLQDIFSELDEQLEKTLDEVILSTDMRTRNTLKADIRQVAEITLLDAFFGSEPSKNISDWKRRTARRIKTLFESEGILV